MKARDIMTTAVISVTDTTLVRDVAALMIEKRVSGVPVLSADGKIQGIVSQSDLLHRNELGTDIKRKWWLRAFTDADQLATEYAKAHGLKAADVMTRHIVSVQDDADISDVAAILDRNKIKRVLVMRNGTLVGVLSRTDLVNALKDSRPLAAGEPIQNAVLHRALLDKMKAQPWLSTGYLNVIVSDGAVQLWGHVETQAQHRALRVLVDETPGVTKVEDHLAVGRLPMAAT
jgi:CBS domain-containing protein